MIPSFTNFLLAVGVVLGAVILIYYVLLMLLAGLFRWSRKVEDVAWPAGILLLNFVTILSRQVVSWRQTVVWFLILLWGLRWTWWNIKKEGGESRVGFGRLTRVYLYQAVLSLVVFLPAAYVFLMSNQKPNLDWMDYLGAGLWTLGFWLEIGLSKILKGKAYRWVWWGEILVWLGIFVMASSISGGWKTVLSPILVGVLLLGWSTNRVLKKKFTKYNYNPIETGTEQV